MDRHAFFKNAFRKPAEKSVQYINEKAIQQSLVNKSQKGLKPEK